MQAFCATAGLTDDATNGLTGLFCDLIGSLGQEEFDLDASQNDTRGIKRNNDVTGGEEELICSEEATDVVPKPKCRRNDVSIISTPEPDFFDHPGIFSEFLPVGQIECRQGPHL